MNHALFASAFILFFVSHGIADYWIQTDFQARNKAKDLWALSRHVLTYTLCFIPALLILGVSAASWEFYAVLLSIGLPHAWMDRRTFLSWFLRTLKDWHPWPEKATLAEMGNIMMQHPIRVHVSIEMDQRFHYLCLAATAAWIAS